MYIKKHGDFWMGLAILAFAVTMYYNSLSIEDMGFFELGPTVFPRFFLGILAFLAILITVRSVASGNGALKSRHTILTPANRLRMLVYGVFIVYLVALPHVGYIVSTASFIFVEMVLLGKRTPRELGKYAVVSILGTAILYVLFGIVLKLFLP